MSTYSLIFSNNRNYRLARHSLFWLGWILYYTIFSMLQMSKYPYAKTFFPSLFEIVVSTPLDMIYCYSIIYFLIPRFLNNGRYISLVLLWVLFSIVYFFLFQGYFIYILPQLRKLDGLPAPYSYKSLNFKYFAWQFFNLFPQINMEGCLAASIKLGKLWHIKKQELELIKNEKQKIAPLIDEGQIQPVFFADILNRIEIFLNEKPMLAAGMIKKIKSLMLYAMYDNNQSKVNLDKELELLQEYVELEKMALDNRVTINLKITPPSHQEQIAPFIILPIAENAFKQLSLHSIEKKALEIDAKVVNGVFNMTLSWSKPADTSTLYSGRGIVLQNISKRLNLIYPQSHELKVFIKVDNVVITLKINLHKAITS